MKFLSAIGILFLFVLGNTSAQEAAHNHSHGPSSVEFIENNNQWHENVLYRAGIPGGIVYLEENALTYNFLNGEDRAKLHDIKNGPKAEQDAFTLRAHAWKLIFINANTASLSTKNKQKHYYNYFIGDDESKWAGHVEAYHSVFYDNIYDGINLKTYSHEGNFKYDWIVSPNGNPNDIQIKIEGIETPTIIDGNLILKNTAGEFEESKPFVYQLINGKMVEIESNYLLNNKTLSYEFPNGYNTSYELIIDPELIAATLSGTPDSGDWTDNYGHTATFDNEGNIYTGATAGGSNYPATTGAYELSYGGGFWDFGISKLNPEGTDLLWATFLGGSEADYPHSMVTNLSLELYILGSTSSSDYPTTSSAFQNSIGGGNDIVISHLSADGSSLIGSTYMGGAGTDGQNILSVNYGDTYRGEIIIDLNEKPVVASCTASSDFPTTGGAYQTSLGGQQDAVLFRLNPTLSSLEMSTFYGNNSNDNGYAVKVIENGDLYLAGTAGDNLSITTGAYQSNFLGGTSGWGGDEMDGFIARFDPTGSTLIASTYLGTTSGDQVFFLELDSEENIFVYGQGGTDWPVVGTVYNNPDRPQYISKLNPDLTDLLLSTTIGGAGGGFSDYDFVPDAFLVDNCDNIYISAYNAYDQMPMTDDALYTEGGFYLAVYSPEIEEMIFGTAYSGDHVDGGTSRFDKNGTVYQAVCSGGGFTTTADAWATDQETGWDIGIFKIDFDASGVNASISGADINGCAPFVTSFENLSNGDQFLWDFGDGGTSTEFEPEYTYENPGVYTISLIVSDSLSCNLADTSTFDIVISTPTDYTSSFDVALGCGDLTATCTNTTGIDFLQYLWDFGDGTVVESYDASHVYEAIGDYTILLTAIDNGCDDLDTLSIDVTIVEEIIAIIDNDNLSGCSPFLAEFNNNSAGTLLTWDFGDGTTMTGNSVSHEYNTAGTYTVSLLIEGIGDCDGMDTTSATVTVIEPLAESIFTFEEIIACEEIEVETTNLSSGSNVTFLWEFSDGATSIEENVEHTFTGSGNYSITLNVFDNICNATFSSVQSLTVPMAETYSLEDVFLCHDHASVMVNANNNELIQSYNWSTGGTAEEEVFTDAGNYTVQVLLNNCWIEEEFSVLPVPQLELDSPLKICQGTDVLLSVPYSGGQNFIWSTQENNSYISVTEPGEYSFSFTDAHGCYQSGAYEVEFTNNSATVYIPNSFTPNNDGINDYFYPVTDNLDEYSITIYNAWGEIVYFSTDPTEYWTGQVNSQGKNLIFGDSVDDKTYYTQNGTYTYKIIYSSLCNSELEKITGSLTILR